MRLIQIAPKGTLFINAKNWLSIQREIQREVIYPTTNVYKYLQTTINVCYTDNPISIVDFCSEMEIRQPVLPGNTYHICTKANGSDVMFHDSRDYAYFKRKMEERLTEAWEILAFVLIPGEMHLVAKIIKTEIDGEVVNHSILLGHLLNGYVQHHNYVHGRSGSLLNRSFRRKKLEARKEIQSLICQIHNLPVAKKLVSRREDWMHSSFRRLRSLVKSGKNSAAHCIFDNIQDLESQHSSMDVLKQCILIPKVWLRKYSLLELLFWSTHPLGGHRWSRRKKPPT